MPTSSLWAEVTISGFLMLLALFFLALKWLGVRDLAFFADLKDFMPILSIAIVAVSYILGVLTHRLMFIFGPPLFRFLRKPFRSVLDAQEAEAGFKSHSRMVLVWQYGSERLHRELDYQFNFLALFISMTVVLPILGASAAAWLTDTPARALAVPILVLGIAAGIAFFIAYLNQSRRYRYLQDQALLEVESIKALGELWR